MQLGSLTSIKKPKFIIETGEGTQQDYNSQKPDGELTGSNAHPGPQKHGGERKKKSIVAFRSAVVRLH